MDTAGEDREWAWLPEDLIHQIAGHFSVLDLVRFRSVCTIWFSAAASLGPFLPCGPKHPLLMLPSPGGDLSSSLTFSSLLDSRLYRLPNLPAISNHRVFGSHQGLLFIVDLRLNASLFNPFTCACIPLPPLTTCPGLKALPDASWVIYRGLFLVGGPFPYTTEEFRSGIIRRAIISDDCTVVLLIHRFVIFARPRDESWSWLVDEDFVCEDAVFVGGTLYVLHGEDGIVSLDLDRPASKRKLFYLVGTREPNSWTSEKYLAVSSHSDCLVVVTRILDIVDLPDGRRIRKTVGFSLRRFDWSTYRWIRTEDLEGMSLFLGRGQTFLLENVSGLRANCVYYTDDNVVEFLCDEGRLLPRDVGVFDLKKKKTFEGCYGHSEFLTWPPPVWFVPSLSLS